LIDKEMNLSVTKLFHLKWKQLTKVGSDTAAI
jgi:hypothetical protein